MEWYVLIALGVGLNMIGVNTIWLYGAPIYLR